MKRRRFILSLVGGAAVGWTGWKTGSSLFPIGTDSNLIGTRLPGPAGGLAKITRSTQALGTQVSLTIFHPDVALAEEAINQAFKEIELVEGLMSIYRPDSQLSQLNQHGILDNPHPYLLEVFRTAAQLAKETQGAFDITVQPLWNLYAECAESGETPDEQSLSRALTQVDWRKVEISPGQIRLQGKGTAVTLNGIAQGFASDAISKVLQAHGITSALIDSGEIGTIGSRAQNKDWNIGIKHPRKAEDFLGMAHLHGRSLATSGDYETRFGEDYSHHHLLDPHTGKSANELSSVSIVAPTGLQADALSTAVFVLGLQKGMKLVEATPDVDGLLISKRGQVFRTPEFPFIT